MAEVVNLNKVRKARRRAVERDGAAANRVRFGRSGAERANDEAVTARAKAALDGRLMDARDHAEASAGEDGGERD